MIGKEALKHKMGKTINIEIKVTPHDGEDKELQKSSDLAPSVQDSDEPGVVKSDDDVANKGIQAEDLLKNMPTPAPMDKNSLNARARQAMMDKIEAKKGLKV